MPEIKFDHNFAVSKLLENGFPLFINKVDARKEAVSANLTGFKYLKLNPTSIKIGIINVRRNIKRISARIDGRYQ